MSITPGHDKQRIWVAVDAIIFTVRNNKLHALLIQMKKHPYEGRWAFPGGLIGELETTEEAARRILKTQTGVEDVYLEQLATFDGPKRDPFGRVISVAYLALVPSEHVVLKTTDRYEDVAWRPVDELPELAYDHSRMASDAIRRLRAKLEYTNVAWSLLPEVFSLTELQNIYEAILDRPLDKRNFRKKMLSLRLLAASGKKRKGSAHRPAELYRFRDKRSVTIHVL